MPVRVSIDLPEHVFAALRQSPAEFVQSMRIAAAVKWYETGRISQGRAAEIAGLSREDFLGVLGQFGVTPFQASADELADELRR